MKKSEFKKIMKKENKAFKNFYLYGGIVTFLLIIVIFLNVLLNLNETIPLYAFIINAVLAFAVAIPFVIIDVKNDIEIKKMYESYQTDSKIPEYKDKTKSLKILLILSIIVFVIDGFIMARLVNFNCTEDLRTEWEEVGNFIINSLSFTDYKD